MLKVLLLQDDFPPRALGGSARVASELARGLHKRGYEVRIITSTPNKGDAGEYEYEGMKVYALYSNYAWRWQAYLSLYNPATIPHVKRIMHEFKPDVVHAHNIHYRISYHALKLAKQVKARVILTTHDVMLFHYGKLHDFYDPHDLSPSPKVQYKVSPWQQLATYRFRYNPFRNVIIKYYLNYCDELVAVSHEQEKTLAANDIYATKVVYAGIDVEQWKGKSDLGRKFRAKRNFDNRPILLFAGRISEAKGGEQILQMLTAIVKNKPNVLLVVAGRKDEYAQKMEKNARELGVQHNIFFTEWLENDELVGVYHAADVVLFPTICFDTFGLVNLEAMASEKPVVATCFGGAKEATEDGVTGTIVNPRNIEVFTAAVNDFLDHPDKSKQFAKAGLERVQRSFTLDRYIQDTLETYTT